MTAPSLRTTISLSAVRNIRLRVAAVAAGCDQAQIEVGAELHQLLSLPFAQRWRLGRDNGSDLAFYSVHGLQCLIPAALQLAGHEAIGGVDCVVLPTGMRGLVARR